MEYLAVISLILSVLSFSAAVWMKISERKWKKAMLDCIQQECKSACDIALNHSNEIAKALNERIDDVFKRAIDSTSGLASGLDEQTNLIQEIQGKFQELSLDYSQAQSAANHINDFAKGLMNLFDYDPMTEIQRKRESGDN